MMNGGTPCPICLGVAEREWTPDNRLVHHYECETCGEFLVPEVVLAQRAPLAPNDSGYRLSAFIRERKLRGADPPIFFISLEGVGQPPPNSVLIDDALAAFPDTVSGRLDRTLLNVARLSPKPGARVHLTNNRDYPIGYAEDDDVFD